jgi:hypothetical protein
MLVRVVLYPVRMCILFRHAFQAFTTSTEKWNKFLKIVIKYIYYYFAACRTLQTEALAIETRPWSWWKSFMRVWFEARFVDEGKIAMLYLYNHCVYCSTTWILHHWLFALVLVLKMRYSFHVLVTVISQELFGTMLASMREFLHKYGCEWLFEGQLYELPFFPLCCYCLEDLASP